MIKSKDCVCGLCKDELSKVGNLTGFCRNTDGEFIEFHIEESDILLCDSCVEEIGKYYEQCVKR